MATRLDSHCCTVHELREQRDGWTLSRCPLCQVPVHSDSELVIWDDTTVSCENCYDAAMAEMDYNERENL